MLKKNTEPNTMHCNCMRSVVKYRVFFIISILYHTGIDFKNETKTVNEWLLQRLLNYVVYLNKLPIRELVNNLLKTCYQHRIVIRNAKQLK